MELIYKQELRVNRLSVRYAGSKEIALNNISFELEPGASIGIIGESGSGKTTLALTMMGLLDSTSHVDGEIYFEEREFLGLGEKEKEKLRWKHVALMFQNALEVLNPIMKVGQQVIEPLRKLGGITDDELNEKLRYLFNLVKLDINWQHAYPHQLSGGMRQRVLLAMALACKPKVLIMDEPTSSLDPVGKKELLKMIKEIQAELGFSLLVISHDLTTIKELTQKLIVLYNGQVLETGETQQLLEEPKHPYTAGFLNSAVDLYPYKDLWGIRGEVQKTKNENCCAFSSRCTQKILVCEKKSPELFDDGSGHAVRCHQGGLLTLLKGTNLVKRFSVNKQVINAVNGCNLYLRHGETVALVGSSGSGKSTLAHLVAGYFSPDRGEVTFLGKKIYTNWAVCQQGGIQLVLQDPFSSLSHRLTVEDAIKEPLVVNKIDSPKEYKQYVMDALNQVQLPSDDAFMKRLCSTLSGGQRQRVAVARALVMKPRLLVADEITSMLDVSTQANLLRLLKGLQNSNGFAMLLITHDIQVARKVSERIIVMHHGSIVDEGSASTVIESCCCHTKELIEAGL